jgi:hypothetical protein
MDARLPALNIVQAGCTNAWRSSPRQACRAIFFRIRFIDFASHYSIKSKEKAMNKQSIRNFATINWGMMAMAILFCANVFSCFAGGGDEMRIVDPEWLLLVH